MKLYGIGIDIVEISRFTNWHTKSQTDLKKIYSDTELELCFAHYSETTYSQFFASRFTLKEAFFKAFSQTLVNLNYRGEYPSFAQVRTLCSSTKHSSGVPLLEIDWKKLNSLLSYELPNLHVLCSISHEKSVACAQVVIEKL